MSSWENCRQYFHIFNLLPSQASISYHGLMNQGATCYLNSVLQVLFMTKDFKEAVKRCTDKKTDTEKTNCIDQHLKSLFDDLEERQAYTYNITRKLGINSVYEQQDAAEYFEKILGLTSPDASKIFQGQLTHKTKCSTCLTPTNEDVAFWHLPLDLVDSYSEDYSVVNGIDEFFKTSVFTGQNQMYCDECDAKSDATIKYEVKHHPEVLMLLLKRFKFDYRYMNYVKITCSVSVPHTLRIPENQTYELYAFVDHFGDLRSGHYSATIMSQDDQRWYKFNDTMVTLLEYQPLQVDYHMISNTAYLLFYRKKEVRAADTCAPDTEQMHHPASSNRCIIHATSHIYEQGPDDAEMRGRAEFERAAEAGSDTAEAVSGYTKKATGMKSTVHEEFRGVGLSRDLYDGETQQHARPGVRDDEEGNGSQRDEVKITIEEEEDEEDMRGKTFRDVQLEQSVDHQDSEGQQGVTERRPEERPENHETRRNGREHQQEVRHMHARPDYPCADRRKGEEMGVNRDKDGKMRSGGESERRASTKSSSREAKHHVRQNMYGDQEAGRDVDLKVVSVDEQEKMEVAEQVDRGRKPKAGRYLTRYDLCNSDIQSNARASEGGKTTEGEQRSKHATSRFYQEHEPQREEKRGVHGERQHGKEDDQPAHRRGTSERQKQDQNPSWEDLSRTAKAREEKKEQIQAGSSREGQSRDAGPKKGRRELEQPKIYHGQIIEEEWQDGDRTSIETENFRIKAGKLDGSIQSLVEYSERRSDPSKGKKIALSEGVNNMKLDDSQRPQAQKHRAEGKPGAEVQAGNKLANKYKVSSKKRFFHRSSPLKQREQHGKTCECFSALFQKKAEQASDTD